MHGGFAPCRFARDRSGATAIEYGLICALISGAIVLVAVSLGDNLDFRYGEVVNALTQ
ncbi:Flp family type IVb pilin [Aureimonas mangrovi]|uniref:Flp family type IVb pilin n=1 Tax=Aureimonas mangrovi TaxID=2758041 RepID=UPI00163D61B9|nr:Flp family type IVb pilin [Aureimonas mangrovi]